MKKIVLMLAILLVTPMLVFADEIINSKGTIIPCKITSINDVYVEYQKDGTTHYLQRYKEQPIFNDYVDVFSGVKKGNRIIRYTGKILSKDFRGIFLITGNEENMQIPWYRIKFIGVYDPN